MGTSAIGTGGCSALMIIIIGIEQIGVYLTTIAVALMMGQGFQQFLNTDVGYTYISWFCLSMLVAVVSTMHCVLAVLFMRVMIKRNKPGLMRWAAVMTWASVAQGLTILAMLAVMLRELLTFSRNKAYIAVAVPKVELDLWRISLSTRPVASVANLLLDFYGYWVFGFAIFWSCVLWLNVYSIGLVTVETIENHRNNTRMIANEIHEVEALLYEGRTAAIPSVQHANVHTRVDTEVQNRLSLYPVADLQMALMNATQTQAAANLAPSAPSLHE